MSDQVCVDASLAVKLVVNEENSDKARLLWGIWAAARYEIIAPCHLAYETVSVVRNLVYRSTISQDEGETAKRAFLAQGVRLLHPHDLHERAWQLAIRFKRPTVYDAYYLAVGEIYHCEVWTADRRLYRAVQQDLPWVKLLDFYRPAKPD